MGAMIAVPIDGKPPEKVRRMTGRLAALFTAPGKMCVPYVGREHVYVRYGRDQWARVQRSRK
jgi:hypothetical protein